LPAIVFVCGISAILFVLGIFFFVTKEGIGFVFEKMDFREFFLTPTGRRATPRIRSTASSR
jgi:phosphate transport system permease protein